MTNNSKKKNLVNVVVEDESISIPKSFIKNNCIEKGKIYSLSYDDSNFIIPNDNISNYLNWMIHLL